MQGSRRGYRKWFDQKHLVNLVDGACEGAITIITLPYYLLDNRHTKAPLIAIAAAKDEGEAAARLRSWLVINNKEAQYVQVADAVIFTSAMSSLSWTDLSGRRWSGQACWYASIVLAITSVLSGAQQTILLDSTQLPGVPGTCQRIRSDKSRPHWRIVFAWQCPLMFLSYSLIFYLAGLTSYIVSPVVINRGWTGDTKTMIFYLVNAISAFLLFSWSSRLVHRSVAPSESTFESNQLVPND